MSSAGLLPSFYQEIINIWVKVKDECKVITKNDIKNENLWLNKLITSNNEPMYDKICIKNKLYTVGDLLSDDDNFLDLVTLNNTYGLKWTFLDYYKVRLSIPLHWRNILGSAPQKHNATEINLSSKLNNFKTLKSKDLYWILVKLNYDIESKPPAQVYWEQTYGLLPEMFETIYMLPFIVIKDLQIFNHCSSNFSTEF